MKRCNISTNTYYSFMKLTEPYCVFTLWTPWGLLIFKCWISCTNLLPIYNYLSKRMTIHEFWITQRYIKWLYFFPLCWQFMNFGSLNIKWFHDFFPLCWQFMNFGSFNVTLNDCISFHLDMFSIMVGNISTNTYYSWILDLLMFKCWICTNLLPMLPLQEDDNSWILDHSTLHQMIVFLSIMLAIHEFWIIQCYLKWFVFLSIMDMFLVNVGCVKMAIFEKM